MDPIIPGLIDDLGMECLIRVPFYSYPSVSTVCKTWNTEIQLPSFHRLRKESGLTRPVFVLAQALPSPPHTPANSNKYHATPAYWLTLFHPDSGTWTRLPSSPAFPAGLPMFCGVVSVGSDLIVMGGWDPETWRVSNAVHVFDFLTGHWRRGSDLPGPVRSLFGLAGDPESRTVLVAGGYDDEKTALRSAIMYDVARDMWAPLPDMARERDECSVVFHAGRFHVISGYETSRQGCFGRSAESLDPTTWQWGPIDESFLEASAGATGARCWVVGNGEGEVYTCKDGCVAVRRGGGRWEAVAEMPDQVRSSQKVMMWEDKMAVIGCPVYGEPHNAYVLELTSGKWRKVEMPGEYSGHVQSGWGMEL